MPLISNIPPSINTIRILIATDNHVGYNENDPIRGDDGWQTFQEITNIAKENDVDMILQAGDLFHTNKPSKKSMYHVIRCLRLNCFGDKPCELELLSDPGLAVSNGFDINYEDPNLNVAIPVFGISGNHDDATGEGLLSPLDLLSVSGLINHFGKVLKNDDITVSPLLFQKGNTKLALYGMANVRDERLFRTFRDQRVKFLKPSVREHEWFNLMAVHQNHTAHTSTSYLPENFLPNFLDLVVWGHEHECIPQAVMNPEMNFDTLQPGSSVATSLSEGETAEKSVFIVNIQEKNYSLEQFRLKTVRPFVMEDISLSKTNVMAGPGSKTEINILLTDKIEELIQRAKDQYKERNPDLFEDVSQQQEEKLYPLPLIRLRVEYSGGYEVDNPRRFSNRFVDKVANVNDVVQFYRKRESDAKNKLKPTKFNDIEDTRAHKIIEEESIDNQVKGLVEEFLKETELNLLPEEGLNEIVSKYVENEDKSIFETYIKKELKNDLDMLMRIEIDDDSDIKQVIEQIKKASIGRNSKKSKEIVSEDELSPVEDITGVQEKLIERKEATKRSRKKKKTPSPVESEEEVVISDDSEDSVVMEDDVMEISDVETFSTPTTKRGTRGRARGRARGNSIKKPTTTKGTASLETFFKNQF